MQNQGTFLVLALSGIFQAGARMHQQAMAVLIPNNSPPPRYKSRDAKGWPKQHSINASGVRQGARIAKQIERNRLAGKPHPFAASGQAYKPTPVTL